MSKTIRIAGPLQSIPPLASATAAVTQDALPPIADTSDGNIGDLYGSRDRQIHCSNSKRF